MKKFYEEIFLIIDNFAIDLVISIAIYFFISHSFSKYQNLLTEIWNFSLVEIKYLVSNPWGSLFSTFRLYPFHFFPLLH